MNNDDIHIKYIESWKLSYSKEEKCLCINTTDYHSFPLKLSRDDLQELLETVDKLSE